MFEVERMSVPTRTTLGRWIRRAHVWLTRVAAVGPDDDLGQRFGAIGPGTFLAYPTGPIFNEHAVQLGRDTLIGPNVALTVGMAPGQPLEHSPVVVIGDRCNIGRGSHIVGHRSIVIGDDVTTGPYVYVTDQNHVYADPDVPITRQWPSEEPVVIGDGCWLGVGCVVLPGTRLGRNVVVAANAVVGGDVPDHSVVAGAPAKVVRRFVEGRWEPPLRDVPINPPAGWGQG